METNGEPLVNGKVDEHAAAEVLKDEATVGYRPVMPLEALWLAGSDMPQITLHRDREFMLMHPIVQTAMEYYKSGIAGAEFWGGPDHGKQGKPGGANDQGKPISPDPRVAAFVAAHAERFWDRGVPLLQEGYAFGWCPGEHVYKEVQGYLVWSHLKNFHPSDGYILTGTSETKYAYQPVGIRVKNIREREPVDMWFASERIPAKAAWYAHRPRFSQFYGRSQLLAAWRPWRRLAWRDAVEQVQDAAVYRAGYAGPIVKHPPGHSAGTAAQGIPATRLDGVGIPRREYRDVARQIVEYLKAGAGITLSSETYPGTNTPKWEVEWPTHVMDVSPLIKYAEHLEDQVMLGIGVPPELVKAGGTGSGYSGRSIPREAFLDGQQRVADAMLQMFVEQVIRPLVLWNFGNVPFEVHVRSLLQSQADAKQGDDQQQGKGGKPQGGENGGGEAGTPPGQQPPQAPPQPAPAQPAGSPMLSLPAGSPTIATARLPLEERAQEIVRRWRAKRRRAAA